MKKNLVNLLLIVYCFLFIAPSVRADYVLPYPSFMPGNKLYRITRIIDECKRFWYFGNIAQVKYHLGLADKYLVEAKTLMEYKQFLLGADALRRSDKEFGELPAYIAGAKKEHVDVTQFQQLIVAAGDKHVELLTVMLSIVPDKFTWTPEKSTPTELPLGEMIKTSVSIRHNIASWHP